MQSSHATGSVKRSGADRQQALADSFINEAIPCQCITIVAGHFDPTAHILTRHIHQLLYMVQTEHAIFNLHCCLQENLISCKTLQQ